MRHLRTAMALLCSAQVASCASPPASGEYSPGLASGRVTIHEPPKLTSIESHEKDSLERPLRVSCVSCHGTRASGQDFPGSASELKEFHTGLIVKHGSLECTSCHVPETGGEPMLRLASGRRLATSQTMELCAQCHGPKFNDYESGLHGGMTGHWDLTRGGRDRNHCVDCHDPHVPAFQPSLPVLPPMDRGSVALRKGTHHE